MRLVVLVLTLIFISNNFANASLTKQYIKQANTPIITSHEQAKELTSMKDKLARKGGGKTASTNILGTYRLIDSSESSPIFLDIIDAVIKNDSGLIEFVLSDSSGFVIGHSLGILIKNVLSFQNFFFTGSQYYTINLDPKKNYSGQGAGIYDIVSDCSDQSGDGFIEVNELYICQFIGSNPQLATITLDRIR